MYRSSLFVAAALIGTTVALVQPAVAAKSAGEVEAIAKSVIAKIKLENKDSNGSGVIIQKQGNLYTLITNRHVICGRSDCARIPINEVFTLELPDGQQYKVPKDAIKLLSSSDSVLDLAIIQFRSSRNYKVAQVSTQGDLKTEDNVYTAGFPAEEPGFTIGKGNVIAVVNKRLTGDSGGYTVIYNAQTLPGMSGGGVFDSNGQLVAIHGYGDRFRENTEIDNASRVGSKVGLNRGIPVRWLVKSLIKLDIKLGSDQSIINIEDINSSTPTTADEYFIAGFNAIIDPGDNFITGKKQAIQKLSVAIRLNPKYQFAYFMRAIAYEQVQDFQKSLADYNQSIFLNPKFFNAYFNRAKLKDEKLNDTQGALIDYDQTILLNPNFYSAYLNRGVLKYTKLNDAQGAVSDYNQSIILNPKLAAAYLNRGILKYTKLSDPLGALSDFNQAIVFNPKFPTAYYNRALLKDNLNNTQEALADYNQAILFDPKYANAYNNRAILKYTQMNDQAGAIQDLRQAAKFFREQENAQGLQMAIKNLQKLDATE
jgi:tetratricopeptide (TPR) repeat protein/V8-like Glu-specific endopeptidase